jgi:GT2 family glycosyltransferase
LSRTLATAPAAAGAAPLRVDVPERPPPAPQTAHSSPPATARVAALIVTWNRRQAVDAVLNALARQSDHRAALDIVVIDNGSTDGTVDWLAQRWRPEAIFDNPTPRAHEPDFRRRPTLTTPEGSTPANAGGFASLTLIANGENHGGCGGFNTGLAFAAEQLDTPRSPLQYAWLIDDDVDLPENALAQLTRTAAANPDAGLIGSRTVDFADRRTTIETTIYFDFDNGWMGPDPTPGHRQEASHRDWLARIGGTRGDLPFSGTREVDVLSASSLLARWEAVKQVGFWDHRYFIYCDDADWCLRFARRGYKVLLDLDAVVYHTYWLSKLTPTRGYYAQRNLAWVIQKAFRGRKLRRAIARRLASLLLDSRKAMIHCRLFHAEIYRRTAQDIISGRGGRLDDAEPPFEPLLSALDRAGALRAGATVLVMCPDEPCLYRAEELRRALHHALVDAQRLQDEPAFAYLLREDVPDIYRVPGPLGPHAVAERIRYQPNPRSKWRAQRRFLHRPADAVIVFNQTSDFPLLRNRANIHVDTRRPGHAQFETDTWRQRSAFIVRWIATALLAAAFALTVRRYRSKTRYG